MTTLLLAWVIGSSLVLGYVLGAVHEISRNRRRRAIRTQRIPLLLKQSAISANEIKLPDLSRWKRGGRR